jgi:hypothetical protein
MTTTLKADGDTWRAELGGKAPREGQRILVFFCSSNDQRPYRVVEVPETELSDPPALSDLNGDRLRDLFDRSVSMGARAS